VAANVAVKLDYSFGRDSENLSRPFFAVMASVLEYLISAWVFLLVAGSASIAAAPPGFVEGHLKIVSPKEVELTNENNSTISTENYAEYPLIIVSQDEKREIARVIADGNGNYRIELPPGDYVLDIQRRPRGRVRATPQPFTVMSGQTVRVDMDIDTGIR
jgi:hypothetical protein